MELAEKKQEKIGILVEGGGMKCSYGAGVLDAFLEQKILFDYGIGVSAGAANLASFFAGQKDRNRRFYCEHCKDPNYFGPLSLIKTGSLFGLSYIYGTMTNEGGIDPLDYDALMKHPGEMYFPATDAKTGKPVYFSKKDLMRNQYEPIMATCALPVVCKPVKWKDGVYFDGGVSDSIPIQKAFEDGCTKVIAVMTKPRDYIMSPQRHKKVYSKVLLRYPKIIDDLNQRHLRYNESLDSLRSYEREGKVLRFCPPDDMQITTYTIDPAITQQMYDLGYQEGKEKIQQVKEFLSI